MFSLKLLPLAFKTKNSLAFATEVLNSMIVQNYQRVKQTGKKIPLLYCFKLVEIEKVNEHRP